MNNNKNFINEHQEKTIRKMAAENFEIEFIAERIGHRRDTVRAFMKRFGIKRPSEILRDAGI